MPSELGLADGFRGDFPQQILGKVHEIGIHRVGLIELQHGEFGIVPGGKPFVAEVAVELEHFAAAADEQPLEIQLGGDAQIHRQVERVVVGDERARRGATGDHLQHRRFDFHESGVVKVVADRAHDVGAQCEAFAGFRIGDQIDIAAAVPQFGVGEALVLVGQRPQGFAEQGEIRHAHGQLALAGAEHLALGADDVAEIEEFQQFGEIGGQLFMVQVQLDGVAAIVDHQKGPAHTDHPAGETDPPRQRLEFVGVAVFAFTVDCAGAVGGVEIIGEGLAPPAQRGKLAPPLGDQLVFARVIFRVWVLGWIHVRILARVCVPLCAVLRGHVAKAPTSGWLR